MNWFYANAGQQVGPVTETEFDNLVRTGTIQADTLVWREGMPEWRPYRDVAVVAAPAVSFAGSASAALDLRPMGIGDILDRTFRLYRTHFMPFYLLMLC